MGPFIFLRCVTVPGVRVSGAAAAAAAGPRRIQTAVRGPAGAGARVAESGRRGAGQLHLDAERRGGAAAHV